MCFVSKEKKVKMQENENKETSTDKVQSTRECKKKNPGGDEIFRTLSDWTRGPPSLLYNGYRVSFPRVKRPARGVNNPLHLAPRLKKE